MIVHCEILRGILVKFMNGALSVNPTLRLFLGVYDSIPNPNSEYCERSSVFKFQIYARKKAQAIRKLCVENLLPLESAFTLSLIGPFMFWSGFKT